MPDERVVIIGSGLIGLCAAAALAARGVRVTLISDHRAGEASPAAAGMLAPGVEPGAQAVRDFGVAARDRYPAFLDWVRTVTGISVALDRNGILQIAATDEDARRLRADHPSVRWLDASELARLEPSLAPSAGALWHEHDGAVDNAALFDALRAYSVREPLIELVVEAAVALEPGSNDATVRCAVGRHYTGSAVVIAAGAWTTSLRGLPRPLPIEPVRGQMLSLAPINPPLRHVIFGGGGYFVPRADGSTFVGSTMERAGFDPATTPEARAQLAFVAATLSPALAAAKVKRHWAGLRPVTPDFQPILGRDPDRRSVIYACGHSRNGILMAPLTGDCVAALACGEEPWYDLSPFSVTRFESGSRA
jgi:glycine oxidase